MKINNNIWPQTRMKELINKIRLCKSMMILRTIKEKLENKYLTLKVQLTLLSLALQGEARLRSNKIRSNPQSRPTRRFKRSHNHLLNPLNMNPCGVTMS